MAQFHPVSLPLSHRAGVYRGQALQKIASKSEKGQGQVSKTGELIRIITNP